jgi:hypothetical protein
MSPEALDCRDVPAAIDVTVRNYTAIPSEPTAVSGATRSWYRPSS